jgi:hypothetical protein
VRVRILSGIVVVIGGLALWVHCRYWPNGRSAPLEQLARQAKATDAPEAAAAAAAKLAAMGGAASEHLRTLLRESPLPRVRAEAVSGLSLQDNFDNVPAILDALSDESRLVRNRAGEAIMRLFCVNFDYRADDPPEIRERKVREIRLEWEEMRRRGRNSPAAR